MAKNYSFSNRFPHFAKFMLLSLVLGLGLTMYSFQNVRTVTTQEASTSCSSIGGGCVSSGRDCSSGYTSTSYTCTTGICCLPVVISAPGSLSATSTCQKGTINNVASFKTTWSAVSKATSYRLYWKTVKADGSTFSYDSYSVSGTSHSFSIALPSNVRFYWWVKGYNKYSKTYGPASATKEVVLNCR